MIFPQEQRFRKPQDRLMLRSTRVSIKTAEEQAKLRVSGRLAADVLDMIAEHVVPGVTTDELDRTLQRITSSRLQQTIPANVGYRGFPKTVCTSAEPRGLPWHSERPGAEEAAIS